MSFLYIIFVNMLRIRDQLKFKKVIKTRLVINKGCIR